MANKEKKYSRTSPIQEYLNRTVLKSSPNRPERIPSERDISKAFQVTRTTVRNAIAEVEAAGLVMHLPGKKGLFTNPRYSRTGMKFIALIFLKGIGMGFSSWMATLFAETHKALNRTEIYYQAISIPEHFSAEETGKFLMRQNYDAFLWFLPSEKFHPLIHQLRDTSFPLTVFLERNIFGDTHPSLIFPDRTGVYRSLAAICKEKSFRRVAMVLWDSKEATLLQSILTEHDITDFTFFSNVDAEFQESMQTRHFDLIFSPGPIPQQRKILNIIANSDSRTAEIILAQEDALSAFQETYPELNIRTLPGQVRLQMIRSMGRKAAESIKHHIYN